MEHEYKKPDLHAPRNRIMIKDILSDPKHDPCGFFARLKNEHPQMANYSNREIAKWIELYNKALADEVVNDPWNGVELPQNLGTVIVSRCKVSTETFKWNIDFNASNKLGIAVPHGNLASDSFIAKINYVNDKPYHRIENYYQWDFKPCRYLQRKVSAEFKKGKQFWFRLFTKDNPISRLFRKHKKVKPTRQQLWEEQELKRREESMINYDPLRWD